MLHLTFMSIIVFTIHYNFLINLSIIFPIILAHIAHNVQAVTDGFWFAIKKMRSIFRKPKTVAETKRIKGEARLRFA